jgi:GH24 family phage-related lysozyme (muramidase)
MNCLRTFAIIVSAVSCVLSACATTQTSNFSSEDTLTPGIFLEPEPRTALPPGVELRKPGVAAGDWEAVNPYGSQIAPNQLRKVYSQGLQLTKSFEGFRGRLYNDAAGYCTIAYGHVVKLARCDGSEPHEFLNGVSEPRGGELLVKDMERAQRAVMTNVTMHLTDGQYAALCDFTFNVGGGNLKSSTLLKVINAGQFDRVPSQFRRWTVVGGKELAGLKARREREIDLFFDGLPKPKAAPLTRGGEDLSPIDIRKGEG